MSTAKEQVTELVKKQPDDSSCDEVIRALAFDLMVQRGLKDSDEGRTITNEEMHRRIKTWVTMQIFYPERPNFSSVTR